MPGVETAERAVVAFTVFSAAVIPSLRAGGLVLYQALFTAMTTVLVLFASPCSPAWRFPGFPMRLHWPACFGRWRHWLWAGTRSRVGRWRSCWQSVLPISCWGYCLLFTGINQFSGMNGAVP